MFTAIPISDLHLCAINLIKSAMNATYMNTVHEDATVYEHMTHTGHS